MFATLTVTLNPQEIEQLIRDRVSKEFNRTIVSLTLDISNQWVGHGPGERQEATFTGATIKLGPVIVRTGD